MKILAIAQSSLISGGIDINGHNYSTVDVLVNASPLYPIGSFVIDRGKAVLVAVMDKAEAIQDTGILADWLEQQGCPQEWTDKLRRFHEG